MGKFLYKFFAAMLTTALLTACLQDEPLHSTASDAAYNPMDVMNVESQTPLQLVKGDFEKPLARKVEETSFARAENYWRQTGGKALMVWHGGEVIFEAYAPGITADTRSRSYSMHKSVVGLVAVKMQEDGLLNLDDPLSKFLPEFNEGERSKVTLRQALKHSTGLSAFSMSSGSQESKDLLMSDHIEKTALKAVVESDNTVFNYANVNLQLAGAAMRKTLKKEGLSYREYLSRALWKPLGSQDAYLWAESETGAPRFYAGLQASAEDWLRLGILISQDGQFMGRTVISKTAMSEFINPADTNPNYGLGVWLGSPVDGTREYGPTTPLTVKHSEPFTGRDVIFFDGFGGQRVYISPSQNLVVVRTGDISLEWDDSLLFNDIANAIRGVVSDKSVIQTADGRNVRLRHLRPKAKCPACPSILFSTGAFATPYDYDRLLYPLVDDGHQIWIPEHVDAVSYADRDKYSQDQTLPLRVDDMTALALYVADTAPSSDQFAMGHSFGALIAQILAGAKMPNLPAIVQPLQIKRTIAISPPGPVDNYIRADAFETISTPQLVVTGTKDVIPPFARKWEDHLVSYETAPKESSFAMVFEGIDHYFNGLYGRETWRREIPEDGLLISAIDAFIKGDEIEGSNEGILILNDDKP